MKRKPSPLVNSVVVLALSAVWVVSVVEAAEQETTGGTDNGQIQAPAAIKRLQQMLNSGGNQGTQASLNLKNVPLEDFLDLVSSRTGMRFVLKPTVKDRRISAFLPGVPVEQALVAVLAANDLTYEKFGDKIMVISEATEVAPEAEGRDKPDQEPEKPPLETKIIHLDFLDAEDIKQTLEPLLSEYGKLQVVKQSGFVGWGFAAGGSEGMAGGGGSGQDAGVSGFGYRGRGAKGYSREVRSQLLVVSDVAEKVELIQALVKELDVQPKQVLISANVVEVNRDKLKDLGVSWGTGAEGAETSDISSTDPWGSSVEFRGNFLSGQVSPGNFNPSSDLSGGFPFDGGATFMFRKVGGSEFQVILHALEEKADANVLSAPKLLTLDNREATILVGNKFPILKTDITGTEVAQVTTSLDYYENIGIQLSVVPQIHEQKYINMIVHPVVSDSNQTVTARGTGGEVLAEYPIIDTRETETEILIADGQTIAIGGLLKNLETKNVASVPVLGDIPLLGALFRRTTRDVQTVDLIIFLSAAIVPEPEESTAERIRRTELKDEVLALHILDEVTALRAQGLDRIARARLGDLLTRQPLDITDSIRARVERQLEELDQLLTPEDETESAE